MKKILAFFVLLGACGAFAAEPLLLINPSRETFVHFPSSILKKEPVVTVFLPEPAVPLRGRYPVVYLLGAGPKDAQSAQQLLAASARKALLVGVSAPGEASADIQAFFTQELMPYIATNYPTIDDPASRAIAVPEAETASALALLARPELFGRAVINCASQPAASFSFAVPGLRVILAGPRQAAAGWQQALEQAGLVFGAGFITRITDTPVWWETLDLDYLFAPAGQLALVKLTGAVSPGVLSLQKNEEAFLSVRGVLADGTEADYIPLSLRLSPPYLDWNISSGMLAPIPGAVPGTVKMSVFVDKKTFTSKIRLKK